MATAVRELVPAKKRAPKKQDGRRNNGGRRVGAGRPEWEPQPQRVQNAAGLWEDETIDQAWNRTRQVIRHYTAIGYPAEVVCKLIEPPCSEAKIGRAHV